MTSILVLAEQRQGKLHPQSIETVVAAQALVEKSGGSLTIAILGESVASAATDLQNAVADRLLLVDSALLEPYNPDATCMAARTLIEKLGPDLILLPHTYQARDYAPRLAAGFRRSLISDCVDLRVEDGKTVYVRQVLQGKANADVTAIGPGPHFVSFQGSAFQADQLKTGDSLQAESMPVEINAGSVRTTAEQPVVGAEQTVDLSAVEIIVSVGRGIEGPENIELAEKLAAAIKGEVGASRPVCDAGWLPIERQIGSSGQTVAPKLYLALGISGSVQHRMGMKGSRTVVAINKDPHAPIFKLADYGIVGNVLEVVPELLDALGSD